MHESHIATQERIDQLTSDLIETKREAADRALEVDALRVAAARVAASAVPLPPRRDWAGENGLASSLTSKLNKVVSELNTSLYAQESLCTRLASSEGENRVLRSAMQSLGRPQSPVPPPAIAAAKVASKSPPSRQSYARQYPAGSPRTPPRNVLVNRHGSISIGGGGGNGNGNGNGNGDGGSINGWTATQTPGGSLELGTVVDELASSLETQQHLWDRIASSEGANEALLHELHASQAAAAAIRTRPHSRAARTTRTTDEYANPLFAVRSPTAPRTPEPAWLTERKPHRAARDVDRAFASPARARTAQYPSLVPPVLAAESPARWENASPERVRLAMGLAEGRRRLDATSGSPYPYGYTRALPLSWRAPAAPASPSPSYEYVRPRGGSSIQAVSPVVSDERGVPRFQRATRTSAGRQRSGAVPSKSPRSPAKSPGGRGKKPRMRVSRHGSITISG